MREVFNRIGGPDSISLPSLIALAFVMYISSLNGSGIDPLVHFWAITLTSFVSLGGAFTWLVIAKFTILKTANKKPLVVRTLVVFTIAFLIRAAIFAWAIVETGATDNGALEQRIILSLPTFGFGLVICAYIVSLGRDFSRSRSRLSLLNAERETLREKGSSNLENDQIELSNYIRTSLTRELTALSLQTPGEALKRMQETIDRFVRPLSLQLAQTLPTPEPQASSDKKTIAWSTVVLNVLTENPIRPAWFASWVGSTALAFSLLKIPLLLSVSYASVVFATSYVGLLLVSKSWSRIQNKPVFIRAVYFTVAIVFVAIAVNVTARLVPEVSGLQEGLLFSYGFISVGIAWFVALVFSLRTQVEAVHDQELEAQTQLQYELVAYNSQLREQRLGLSRVLHGAIQDELTSAAFRLSQEINSGKADDTLLAELVTRIDSVVETVKRPAMTNPDVLKSIHELEALWSGLVKIHVDVSPETQQALAKNSAASYTVIEIIREACSNALRHGKAQNICVQITHKLSIPVLEISICNDGEPVHEAAKPGVGSLLLDKLTLSWEWTKSEGQICLTASIPLEDTSLG